MVITVSHTPSPLSRGELVSLSASEQIPDSLDNFESRHHPVEDGDTRAEIVHQRIRASGMVRGMEQFLGMTGNLFLGSLDFGQLLCFLLENHFQRNRGFRRVRIRIHAYWSLRSKLARNRVRGWMMSRRRNP